MAFLNVVMANKCPSPYLICLCWAKDLTFYHATKLSHISAPVLLWAPDWQQLHADTMDAHTRSFPYTEIWRVKPPRWGALLWSDMKWQALVGNWDAARPRRPAGFLSGGSGAVRRALLHQAADGLQSTQTRQTPTVRTSPVVLTQ